MPTSVLLQFDPSYAIAIAPAIPTIAAGRRTLSLKPSRPKTSRSGCDSSPAAAAAPAADFGPPSSWWCRPKKAGTERAWFCHLGPRRGGGRRRWGWIHTFDTLNVFFGTFVNGFSHRWMDSHPYWGFFVFVLYVNTVPYLNSKFTNNNNQKV